MEQQLQCPKCGSTQLTADKKGFSGKNAVAGAVLTGGIGLLAGTIGSNKVMVTCLACGFQHQAGTAAAEKKKIDARAAVLAKNATITPGLRNFMYVIALLIILSGILIMFSDTVFLGILFVIVGCFLALVAFTKPLVKK